MEREKEIVEKRIERMQRKVEGAPNVDPMLESVKELRKEREKLKELQNQKSEQRTTISHFEQRISRLEQQLKDLRTQAVGATPEGLLQRIEEETRVNEYIVKQKLPKELEAQSKVVDSLQRVIAQPALGQDDIKALKEKIKNVQDEVEEITKRRNVTNDPMEDKLTLFRQQAAIIARKKESTAEKLNDFRNDLAGLEEEVKDKRANLDSMVGETVLRGDDFKRYVSGLRTKSTVYKNKRAELNDLRAEYGVLSRTVDILKSKESQMKQSLASMEAEKGVSGFKDTQDAMAALDATTAGVDEAKGKTLEQMSDLVSTLTVKIGERKARLAPIIKELRPLRQQAQEMQAEHDDRKRDYDTLQLQLESSMSRLESEVRQYQDEIRGMFTELKE